MSLLRKDAVILGCLLFLAIIQYGNCIKCYTCAGSLTSNRMCFDPFDGSKVDVLECPGACYKASATATLAGVGSTELIMRNCDPLNKATCAVIKTVMEQTAISKGAYISDFSCGACTDNLCNSGHLATPAIILLTLGAVGILLST